MKNPKELIFIVDDEKNLLQSLSEALSESGFLVETFSSPREALREIKRQSPRVVVTDIRMPEMGGLQLIEETEKLVPETNFIIMTAHASLDTAIQAIRLGAIDYLIKPFRVQELIAVVRKACSQTRLLPQTGSKSIIKDKYQFRNLISEDVKMKEIYALISKIAKTDSTVLIMGESGTGKEMVARAIHFNSKRSGKPFVSVNCAALPENLLESELFGYEKGAFTGAVAAKQGLFEVANAGTFFMDEVGEIQQSLQAKLLRVLQERVVKHIGGIQDNPIDIRLITATSRNLPKDIQDGKFREDLYYRLNVVPVLLPPLRERQVDIPIFLNYFISLYSEKHGIENKFLIEKDAIDFLKSYQWPGNIRQLENLSERIVTTAEDGRLGVSYFKTLIGDSAKSAERTENQGSDNLTEAVEGLEKKMITEAVAKAGGNKFKAARELGLTRQSLQYKLKKYGLEAG